MARLLGRRCRRSNAMAYGFLFVSWLTRNCCRMDHRRRAVTVCRRCDVINGSWVGPERRMAIMGSRNKKLSVVDSRSAAKRDARTRLWRPGQVQTAKVEAVSEASRRRAEFRLAVVGHLVACDVEKGKLAAKLRSLSERKWKHPITGRRVKFSYPTIERWYYITLNNREAPLHALSRRRHDAGAPRSLIKPVCRHLAKQPDRHSTWSCGQHHRALVSYVRDHGWGAPPGYWAVRRYLKSLRTSQSVAADTKIARLERLVVHLRKTLIVQSTLNKLLRMPELRAKPFGPPFKLSRFQSHEKAYILSRLQDYKSNGGSLHEFCSGVGISAGSIKRWVALYKRHGEAGLLARTRRKFPNRSRAHETRAKLIEIFHNQPRTYGINRASWTGKSLAKALHNEFRSRAVRPRATSVGPGIQCGGLDKFLQVPTQTTQPR